MLSCLPRPQRSSVRFLPLNCARKHLLPSPPNADNSTSPSLSRALILLCYLFLTSSVSFRPCSMLHYLLWQQIRFDSHFLRIRFGIPPKELLGFPPPATRSYPEWSSLFQVWQLELVAIQSRIPPSLCSCDLDLNVVGLGCHRFLLWNNVGLRRRKGTEFCSRSGDQR